MTRKLCVPIQQFQVTLLRHNVDAIRLFDLGVRLGSVATASNTFHIVCRIMQEKIEVIDCQQIRAKKK